MPSKSVMAAGGLVAVGFLVVAVLGHDGDEREGADAASSTPATSQHFSPVAGTTAAPTGTEPTHVGGPPPEATGEASSHGTEPVTRPPRPVAAPATTPADVLSTGEPVEGLVAPALSASSKALGDPDGASTESLDVVADDAALAAIESQVHEYQVLGWSQVGTPEIVSTEIVALDDDADPPTARVQVCLDHSTVQVLDSQGVSMVDESAPMRTLQLWTLEQTDGVWVLVDQTFPDDPTC